MKMILSAVAVMAGLVATDASAQSVNLTGRWQCVASCAAPPGNFAFITQNGWEINMVSDMGVASRAWFNWLGRIWVERANEGAIIPPTVLRFSSTAERSGSAPRRCRRLLVAGNSELYDPVMLHSTLVSRDAA